MQWVRTLDKILKATDLFLKNPSKDDFILNLFGNEKIIKEKIENLKIPLKNIIITHTNPSYQMKILR